MPSLCGNNANTRDIWLSPYFPGEQIGVHMRCSMYGYSRVGMSVEQFPVQCVEEDSLSSVPENLLIRLGRSYMVLCENINIALDTQVVSSSSTDIDNTSQSIHQSVQEYYKELLIHSQLFAEMSPQVYRQVTSWQAQISDIDVPISIIAFLDVVAIHAAHHILSTRTNSNNIAVIRKQQAWMARASVQLFEFLLCQPMIQHAQSCRMTNGGLFIVNTLCLVLTREDFKLHLTTEQFESILKSGNQYTASSNLLRSVSSMKKKNKGKLDALQVSTHVQLDCCSVVNSFPKYDDIYCEHRRKDTDHVTDRNEEDGLMRKYETFGVRIDSLVVVEPSHALSRAKFIFPYSDVQDALVFAATRNQSVIQHLLSSFPKLLPVYISEMLRVRELICSETSPFITCICLNQEDAQIKCSFSQCRPFLVSHTAIQLQGNYFFYQSEMLLYFKSIYSSAYASINMDPVDRMLPPSQYPLLLTHYTPINTLYAIPQIEELVSYAALQFPPCMFWLVHTQLTKGHQKHYGRLQLNLFLKTLGYRVDDALQFWRAMLLLPEKQKKWSKYKYHIKHNYGLVGSGKTYECFSCDTQTHPSITSQPNGCPFVLLDGPNLTNQLETQNSAAQEVLIHQENKTQLRKWRKARAQQPKELEQIVRTSASGTVQCKCFLQTTFDMTDVHLLSSPMDYIAQVCHSPELANDLKGTDSCT